MKPEGERLPDILRPTELHDFGAVFRAAGARRKGIASALFTVCAAMILIAGVLHLVSAASAPPSPAVVVAVR